MRKMSPLPALTAAAAIPLTALALTLGSASSAAGAPVSTTLTWHTLILRNGWSAVQQSGMHFGMPGWAVSGGIVYLRGAISGGRGADLAILPRAARPAHDLWISYVTSGPSVSGLLIRSDGLISLFGPGDASAFSSLSGLSFPLSE